ncbi:DUF2635 domain-containing protein [Azospirillum brasilense]|uniref:DUF2635 domain-containing protein n=1 Tax=Azospirillum brasilense TaxID=192 RepID=A0A4D8QSW6_AZOBR|nr:DUF2635 domain-containing protein [Azospirillum brasilense]QCO13995.1 DUF2635 domain-containing protein [Azospirillum brasilense]
MFVKPKPGLMIRDPDLGDFLPAEGREVPATDYWNRLLHIYRDVVLADPPAPPSPAEEA